MTFLNSVKWSAVGVFSRYLLQTASILILSRLLSPNEFGQVAAVMIVISLALVISQLGMGQLISSCNELEINKKFSQSLIISPSIAFIITLSIFTFSESIANSLNISDPLLLNTLLLSIIIRSLYSPLEGLFIHYYKFDSIAKIDFFSYFFGYFIISLIFSYLGYGSYSIIFANIFQASISLTMIIFMFRKIKFKFDFMFTLDELKATFKRACTISYGQILSGLTSQVDNFFVNKYLGVLNLGIYTRAYQLMVVPCNFSGQIINKVIISRFSKANDNYENIIKKGLLLILLLSIFVSCTISMLGVDLINFLLGEGWSLVFMPLLILSFSIFPRMVYKIVEPVLIAKKLEGKLAVNLKFYFFSMCSLCLLFKDFGIVGISFAVLLSTYIYGAISMYYLIIIYPKLKKIAIYSQILSVMISLLIWNFS
jgi:O-antigen/teichoic acid export membrane protein